MEGSDSVGVAESNSPLHPIPQDGLVVLGNGWVRRGHCCRCGDCCRGNPFDNQSTDEYCPLFRWRTNAEGECIDREHPYYLNGCVSFPTHPTQIADKPNCTYTFDLEENGS